MGINSISHDKFSNPFLDWILPEEPRVCSNHNFTIVEDAYPVIQNHLLLFTNTRILSLADSDINDLILFLKHDFLPSVSYKNYILIERGRATSCSSMNNVIHAHAHLVPFNSDPVNLFSYSTTEKLPSLDKALKSLNDNSQYLLWGRISSHFLITRFISNLPTKFIRRTISNI